VTDIDALLKEQSGIRLDIACGLNKRPGWTGIDVREVDGVDIVHDLNTYPWPLPDGCVLAALCSHYVEHIPPQDFGFVRFMDEVWRVLRPGGKLMLVTPHAWSVGFGQDPTHCNAVNENTLDYFDPEGPRSGGVLYNIYQPKPWKLEYLAWHPMGNVEAIMVKREEGSWNGNAS
jgi:SAM-dependent methyltransferase